MDRELIGVNGLLGVVSNVKEPLIHIQSTIDSALNTVGFTEESINAISSANSAALSLIDGLLMSMNGRNGKQKWSLEPVAIGALLYDVQKTSEQYARFANFEVRLEVSKKCGLVIGDYKIMKNALLNLVYGFMSTSSTSNRSDKKVLKLIAKVRNEGVMVGVFSRGNNLSESVYKRMLGLIDISHQPAPLFSWSSATNIYVADKLFNLINERMRVSQYRSYTGLSTILSRSAQLSMI